MIDVFAIAEQISAKEQSGGFDMLSPPEQVFHAVWTFESELNQGGFDHFFFNSAGDYNAQTLAALRKIGATNCAEIAGRACALFPDSTPSPDQNMRQEQLKVIAEYDAKAFENLNAEFYQYPDDISGLLASFWTEHGNAAFQSSSVYPAATWEDTAEPNPYASPVTQAPVNIYADDDVDRGRNVVLSVIAFFVGSSILVTLWFNLRVGPQRLAAQMVRLSLTVGLAICLYRGHSWARYAIALLLGLAAIWGLPVLLASLDLTRPIKSGGLIVLFVGDAACAVSLIALPSVGAFLEYQRSRLSKVFQVRK